MHSHIEKAVEKFKKAMLEREIKEQELQFDELTKEESDELDKLDGLSDSLINQAF